MELTIIKVFNSLITQQSDPKTETEQHIAQFLNCLAIYLDAKIRLFVSDMLLQIHPDASLMNETCVQFTAAGYFFLGKKCTATN